MNIVWNDQLLAENVDPSIVGEVVAALRAVSATSAEPIRVAVREYKDSSKHSAYYAVMQLIEKTGSAVGYDDKGRYRVKPKEQS